jgi:hypothetical protein
MTTSSSIKHVYDPDTLSIMTDAFDRACDFLPVHLRDSDHMRRKLASAMSTTARVTRRASPKRPSYSFYGNPPGQVACRATKLCMGGDIMFGILGDIISKCPGHFVGIRKQRG